MLASPMLKEALLGAIIRGAGQAGQVDQHGDFALGCLRREIQVEVHLAVCGGGLVAQLEELAAEGGDGGFCGDGHFGGSFVVGYGSM